MKTRFAVWVGIFAFALAARGGVLVGLVGTSSGDPIAGEESITIYNSTGAFGCSTSGGTPICTPATFDNVVLTVNGTIHLDLGNIAPGLADSSTYASGAFVDGSIDSLSLTLSLSTTTLVDDLHGTHLVASAINLSGLPVNGSLAPIDASAAVVTLPEPGTLPVSLCTAIFLLFAALLKRRVRGVI
jgi:hypothetical protein